MKSKTRLDSAAFQLTPTRTRYDLVLTANGKTEKIASGLLNPFLAHLKTAQDQIAKGGYSIILEPDPSSDAAWFTKGTVERFVRFVSNPEVLERVNTIESEILQIGEAIAIQSNDNLGLSTVDVHQKTVDDHQTRSLKSIEGGKPVLDADAGKAIVLYEPGAHPTESNGSTTREESSKVQLLRVLETRKTVLQKEQGMAFARAVAAGFDMDHMAPLISFAECFGASRLREACLRFMDLWKEKHETGQWLEIEAAEAMSSQSDFSSMETKKWPESNCELGMESNGKVSNDTSADKRPPPDTQVPLDHHEYFQGQFQHPIYPHWPIHSPPGAPPVFQAYPMQGIPYYQNYPGNGPFFQPPYPPVEDPRINSVQRMGQKRHSMDSKDSNTELETWEPGVSNTRSQDGSELEKEGSQGREPRRKAGKSGRKNSGMVVIRNINYISSKKQNTSGSESSSGSDPETDEDAEGVEKHKNYMRSSKSEGSHSKPTNTWNTYEKDGMVDEQEVGGGKWQAFQNCLLRNDDQNTRTIERNTFSMEKEGQVMRRKNTTRLDPIVPHGPDWVEGRDRGMTEFDTISGKGGTHLLKASNDELVISGGEFGRGTRDSELDLHHTEIEGQRRGYRRVTNDDFMLYRQENQLGSMSLQSDPLAGEGFESASNNLDRSSSHNVTDESFVVPLRLSSQYQIGTDSRTAIEMDAEFPSGRQKTEDSSSRIRTQLSYEPDDLSLMPERGTQRESIGYDPSLDYETRDTGKVQNRNKEEAMTGVKEGSKRLTKDKKLKGVQDSFEKRKMDAATRKGKPSKLGPSNEAQARAERLRAFKADLQKMKKENEEEGKKRLEALKREREKRIAARGSSGLVQSPLPSQTRPRLPTKLSPSSHKGSKFSDLEPGSSSPLQRLPVRTASVGSNDSQKIIKSSRLNNSSRLAGNGLSRSASSLPELKKEKDGVTPEPKVATTARIRRLSDPKTANRHHVSSPKPKLSDGPENKKISEIMSLDRTKAATLPELKIKTSKGPSVMGQNKSAEKELTQKANGSRSTVVSERTKVKRSNEKTSHDSNGDENPVVEKTVVMLERDTHPIPVVQGSEETMTIKKVSCDDKVGEKTEMVSKYAEVHAPASPCTMGEICQDSSECQLDERPESCEVTAISARKELPTLPSVGVAEKSYQAPYARVSSLEDPCTTNLEYTKASPPSLKMEATSKETAKAHVSNFTDLNSLEQTPETLEKPRGKESSKGFKRLLKFGKKNNSSAAGERNVESEKLAMNGSLADDQAAGSASYEVHTLKNLISQDETPTSSTSQKSSRSFSLLSPFRSKTSEKKQTT